MHSAPDTPQHRSVIKPFLFIAAALALGVGLAAAAMGASVPSRLCTTPSSGAFTAARASLASAACVDPARNPSNQGRNPWNRPPFGAAPEGFSLSVSGSTAAGATVTPTVVGRVHLGLLVEEITRSPWRAPGMVRFGEQPAGTYHLHWNFSVDGEPLPAGNYLVFEEILSTQNLPSGIPPCPDEALLTLSKNGHDRVRMLTIKYPSFPKQNPAPAF